LLSFAGVFRIEPAGDKAVPVKPIAAKMRRSVGTTNSTGEVS
jgi:hypothetical protein